MNAIFIVIIIVFIAGYACIALEHPLKVNKTATALILGVVLWTLLVIGGSATIVNPEFAAIQGEGFHFADWLQQNLLSHLGSISEIIFFLLGAMAVVELIDSYGGFRIITDKIATTNRVKFLWLLSILTFFLSSVLDNMTTAIVMVALLRKLVAEPKDRWLYAGMVVLAANAGGAWTPIGDVTTIMLWVGGKVSALNIMVKTFLASVVSILVPLIILSFRMKGEFQRPELADSQLNTDSVNEVPSNERLLILILGLFSLLFTPVFKSITHLPPYIAIVGMLGIMWVVTEILKRRHPERDGSRLSVTSVLSRVDVSSILFFLGILLAVAALETGGHLAMLSQSLDKLPMAETSRYFSISYLIGLFSAVIDNVPLVAASMGMYGFPADHYFWEFVAYCAGTGGSILIIGSAAGVATMGLAKIDFIWYLKKISLIAFIGYTAGALTYMAQYFILH